MPRPNAYCRACNQPILIVITVNGRRQELNPKPDPAGNVAIYKDAAGTWRAHAVTDEHPALAYEHVHMPHPATCRAHRPQAGRPAPTQLALRLDTVSLARPPTP